jgi:hypothetical protein
VVLPDGSSDTIGTGDRVEVHGDRVRITPAPSS